MDNFAFPDAPRSDARDKVRGLTTYAADNTRPDMAHAALAVATIARGSVRSIDTAAARAVRGVRLVMTHADFADLASSRPSAMPSKASIR